MNVTGISSVSAVLQTTAVSSSDAASEVTQLDGPEPAGVSKMGDLMKQLEELSQSDPEKFKEVMGSLAKQVQQQADAASEAGDGGAGFLGEMAKKLQQAADTGDVSALKPPRPPQGGSPPPQRAKDAYGQSAQQPSLDLAQLIQSTLEQYSS